VIGIVIAVVLSLVVGVVVALVVYVVQADRRARYAALHAWAPAHLRDRRADLIDVDDLNDLRRRQVAEATRGHRDQVPGRERRIAGGGERGVRSA
jgi:hypothetical protein